MTDVVEEGNRLIRFAYTGIWEEILGSLGEMPLPPYITHKLADKNRYQTVYASRNHPCIIQYQAVARAQKIGDLPKTVMRGLSGFFVRHGV